MLVLIQSILCEEKSWGWCTIVHTWLDRIVTKVKNKIFSITYLLILRKIGSLNSKEGTLLEKKEG